MQSVPYFSALDRSDFVWAQALSGDVWPRDRVEFPFSRVVSYVLDLPMKKTEKSGRKREGEGGGEGGKGGTRSFRARLYRSRRKFRFIPRGAVISNGGKRRGSFCAGLYRDQTNR